MKKYHLESSKSNLDFFKGYLLFLKTSFSLGKLSVIHLKFIICYKKYYKNFNLLKFLAYVCNMN